MSSCLLNPAQCGLSQLKRSPLTSSITVKTFQPGKFLQKFQTQSFDKAAALDSLPDNDKDWERIIVLGKDYLEKCLWKIAFVFA